MNRFKDTECCNVNEQSKITIFERLRKIPAIGIVFALFSAFFISTGTLIVKLVDDYHAIEIAAIRSLIQGLFYFIVALVTRTSFRPAKDEHWYLLMRCVFGFMSVMCGFVSLRLIPLGDSSAIIYSAPVFVAVIARVFLKENCDVVNIIAIIFTAGGVALITKPSFLFPDEDVMEEEHRMLGCLLAVCGAFGAACAFVSIRKLQSTPSSVVIFWHSFVTALLGTIVLVFINELQMVSGLRNILLLITMGICGTCGQLCVTLAFKLEEAGPVSLARTLSIVIAFIYQIFLLDEEHEWSSLLGASIVVLSVVSVALRKWYLVRQKKKKKLENSTHSSWDMSIESISENVEKSEQKGENNVIANAK